MKYYKSLSDSKCFTHNVYVNKVALQTWYLRSNCDKKNYICNIYLNIRDFNLYLYKLDHVQYNTGTILEIWMILSNIRKYEPLLYFKNFLSRFEIFAYYCSDNGIVGIVSWNNRIEKLSTLFCFPFFPRTFTKLFWSGKRLT